ncbi:MAG: hypothetical protein ACLGPL_11680 [Acidobacteriota bacterium]
MKRFVLNSDQLSGLMDRAIDLFLKYQYGDGFDEPKARKEAIQQIMNELEALSAGRNLDR